jgi:cbb3-type cytochrome oxidase maturation protein
MEILFILIPVSVILVTLAITLFGWAIKNGQYDDLEGPGHSILYDDDEDMIPGSDTPSSQHKVGSPDSDELKVPDNEPDADTRVNENPRN